MVLVSALSMRRLWHPRKLSYAALSLSFPDGRDFLALT
jgi:hypothetical protein